MDEVKRHLIVIPAYNEEQALPKTIEGLQNLPPQFEILIVNDGSRDRTGETAEELAGQSKIPCHVVHLPLNCGIGVAVQTGYRYAMEHSRYTYVIQFDADGQHDASFLPALVERSLADSLDLCIGSRFLPGAQEGFQSTPVRRVGIRFFSFLIRFLTGAKVTDPTSGFRCAGPKAWKRFAQYYPEDFPEPESFFWCARHKMKIAEIPVTMHERQGGESSIRWSKAIYYMVKVTVAILFDRLRSRE